MTDRVLALYDGARPSPPVEEMCRRLGVDLKSCADAPPPLGRAPRLLLAPASQGRLNRGLSAGFSGFVELTPDHGAPDEQAWSDCIAAVAAGGLALSLSSAGAYSHDIPCPFIVAVARRFPDADCLPALETALYEALANAIIHGNLGLDSSLRGSAEELRDYRTALAHALSDPHRAMRRVVITCCPHGDRVLRLTVRDHGDGWDAERRLTAPVTTAKSGRGLEMIRQVAAAVHSEDQGRLLVMDFHRSRI